MKALISALVLAGAIVVTTPVCARTNAEDKADCEKANGLWDWINTKCLASLPELGATRCNNQDHSSADLSECVAKSSVHDTSLASPD
jgi:hypothetical protein